MSKQRKINYIDDFLKLKQLPALSVFKGSHQYDHDIAAKHAVKLFSTEYGNDGEIKFFSEDATGMLSVLPDLSAAGFFTSAKLAIFKYSKYRGSDATGILQWLQYAPQSVFLVISVTDQLAGSKAFLKTIGEMAEVFSFPEPRGRDFRTRANALIRSMKLSLDSEPAELLIRSYDGDLAGLKSELEKIRSYAGERRTIRMDDIREISSATVAANKFKMVEQLIFGNRAEALNLLERVMREGEQAQATLSTIVTEVRKSIMAAEYIAKGMSPRELADAMHVRYYQEVFFRKGAAFADSARAEKVLQVLVDTERAMKTSMKSPEVLLNEAFCVITS